MNPEGWLSGFNRLPGGVAAANRMAAACRHRQGARLRLDRAGFRAFGGDLVEFGERELRDALGRFVTGVTVVTTMTPEGPLGITANSFASVSLRPPLVLWSPARKSRRFPAFEGASHFAVHVLSVGQQPLAEAFASPGDPFAAVAFGAGLGGVPLLDGCAARFECRHAAGHDAGDHLIVVGEVLRLAHSDLPPLIFHRGRYRALAALAHPGAAR